MISQTSSFDVRTEAQRRHPVARALLGAALTLTVTTGAGMWAVTGVNHRTTAPSDTGSAPMLPVPLSQLSRATTAPFVYLVSNPAQDAVLRDRLDEVDEFRSRQGAAPLVRRAYVATTDAERDDILSEVDAENGMRMVLGQPTVQVIDLRDHRFWQQAPGD